jgi:hypothetical protein
MYIEISLAGLGGLLQIFFAPSPPFSSFGIVINPPQKSLTRFPFSDYTFKEKKGGYRELRDFGAASYVWEGA